MTIQEYRDLKNIGINIQQIKNDIRDGYYRCCEEQKINETDIELSVYSERGKVLIHLQEYGEVCRSGSHTLPTNEFLKMKRGDIINLINEVYFYNVTDDEDYSDLNYN